MSEGPFSADTVISELKDFQQTTVKYVFDRLFGENATSRFLVADEVGLGKTLVAKGIIAKTLEHFKKKRRIDILYICSNASIAKQNINRLNPTDTDGFSLSTRLTYLPRDLRDIENNRVNFISLTPGTAFDHRRSRGGHMEERIILFYLLKPLPWAHGTKRKNLQNGLRNMLQATAGKDSWRNRINGFKYDLDEKISKEFRKEVLNDKNLYEALKECCWDFRYYKKHIDKECNELRYELIGKLRNLLAQVSLSSLKPTLIIMDEFQRFKYLLNGDDEASMLAKKLFENSEAKILLLSATPYKMYTLDIESEEENHYKDFVATLEFLLDEDISKIENIKKLLHQYRIHLMNLTRQTNIDQKSLKDLEEKLEKLKEELEETLLQVMCRTERVSFTHDHNAMLKEHKYVVELQPEDLTHFVPIDNMAAEIGALDTIEYWKSAPNLLNFLESYDFGRKLKLNFDTSAKKIQTLLQNAQKNSIEFNKVDNYEKIPVNNPKMRDLLQNTLDRDMWRLLWMPASMPYTKPNGFYKKIHRFTKTLIFSSWNLVPDAIAAHCSYEAERRIVKHGKNSHTHTYSTFYKKRKPLLRFSKDSKSGRLTGMPVMAWIMPWPTLAEKIDPLAIAIKNREPVSVDSIRESIKEICENLINSLPEGDPNSPEDKRWYWAAPICLEKSSKLFIKWCENLSKEKENEIINEDESHGLFKEHIGLMIKLLQEDITLGKKPSDLADVLCDLALAGPGICALRSLHRISSDLEWQDHGLLSASARIASGFRTLFNMPESIELLRGTHQDIYWRLTLRYGIDGNLQAVMDEYVHTLKESLGLKDYPSKNRACEIAKHIQSAISLRAAPVRIHEIKSSKKKITVDSFNIRCRLALRFSDIKDEEKNIVRADAVRDAFNSPFRPFILASTSIGQEGLDFHTWCHSVVHWNLPSNPVDLEQREGRVHRYKGHAVRKNIAEKYGLAAMTEKEVQDPWEFQFHLASQNKPEGVSDLVPFWIFEDGSSRIERRVPLLPYSKEVGKYTHLKKSLAIYRIAFGQPRQEDFVESLSKKSERTTKNVNDLSKYIISLRPK